MISPMFSSVSLRRQQTLSERSHESGHSEWPRSSRIGWIRGHLQRNAPREWRVYQGALLFHDQRNDQRIPISQVAIKSIKTYSGEDGDFAKKQKVMHRLFPTLPTDVAISAAAPAGNQSVAKPQTWQRLTAAWNDIGFWPIPCYGVSLGREWPLDVLSRRSSWKSLSG